MVATPPIDEARLARPVPGGVAPGHRRPREIREPATRPASCSRSPSRRRTTSPRRRRGEGCPARVGRDELPGARRDPAPRRGHLRGPPSRVRDVDAARDRRATKKMHHEQNFAVGEVLAAATMPWQPYGSLVPTVVTGRLSMIRRIPVGVIGAITPWNSPTVLGMRVVAPALALGNAVILKPDPQTPVCGGAVFAAVFREAGLPDGLLQIVIGDAETGEAIITDPNVDLVSSPARRRRAGGSAPLAGRAAQAVSLELGGNNPLIVLDDADLEAAAAAGALRVVPVPGPGCFATGRHIVHAASPTSTSTCSPRRRGGCGWATRTARTSSWARSSTSSSSSGSTAIVRRSVDAGGARLVDGRHARRPVLPADRPGGRDNRHAGVARGDLRPGGAGRSMFDTDDEALELANDSEYGLAGARLLALDLARPRARQPHSQRAWSTSTTRPSTTRRRSRSAAWARRATAAASAARPTGRVHRVAVGHRPRRRALVPVPVLSRRRCRPSPRSRGSPACRSPRRRASSPRADYPVERRDARAGARRRADARLRARTRSRAACSRARCRSSA